MPRGTSLILEKRGPSNVEGSVNFGMNPLQSGMCFEYNLAMEVLELKREVEQLSERLGKTQEYL